MPVNMPHMSQAGLAPAEAITATDEYGQLRSGFLAAERALTVYLNKQEIITLMTMGTEPELLVLGWLRNQGMVSSLAEVKAINVDWDVDAVAVTTHQPIASLDGKLEKRTVTTGCGQGTVFGGLMDDLDALSLPQATIKQSTIYGLLDSVNQHNKIYKQAGAVHGCALCQDTTIHKFVEDVGRHNAVDALAGHMWLADVDGGNKVFYTTGRLTSEMVIKVAQMGIPVLLSRSGATQMGLEIARKVGVILIARAKGKHFLVYHGADQITLDQIPATVERPRKRA